MSRETNSQQLQMVQSRVLGIYKEIKKICDEHNIRYFAIAGTAIGAVRHSGFIPWDDDIDIAMPRKDYENFLALCHLLPSKLKFTDFSTSSESPIVFGKVQDTSTCYTSEDDLDNPDAYYGVFVDIMPMDGVPSNSLYYWVHRMSLRRILQLHKLLIESDNKINTPNKRIKTIMRIFANVLYKLNIINKTNLKKTFISLVSKYEYDESEYSACMWQFVSTTGVSVYNRYKVADFTGYTSIPFEDTTMRIPIGYKNYFKSVCPDYMTPPPIEKQIPHHGGIIDFNRSYTEYALDAKNMKCKKYDSA